MRPGSSGRRSPGRRLGSLVVLAGALAGVVVTAVPAQAHVEVESSSTAPQSEARLTFVVPTESDTARTTAVTVTFPTDTPIASARPLAQPGWTARVVTRALPAPVKDDDGNVTTTGVAEVVWTATGTGIGPGEFGTLTVSVFPLPRSGTLYLPTVQHYSDGTDVGWVQQAQAGAEPEHPAPQVEIAAPAGPSEAGPDRGPQSGWALGIAGLGAVVSLLAAGAAGYLLARVRRLEAGNAPGAGRPGPTRSADPDDAPDRALTPTDA